MKLRNIFILLFLFLFFSCNESDMGIFYGLKIEEKLKDGSLPNSVTVGNMLKAGTKLYIAAGSVYTKTSGTEEDWSKVNPPSGYDLTISMANAFDGTEKVYAIFYTKNTANKGFFSFDGNSWTSISTASLNGSLEQVNSANNVIFVSTRIAPNIAELYYYTGGAFTKINIDMVTSTFCVIHDGTDYYISNYNKIFKGSLPNPSLILQLDSRYDIKGLASGSLAGIDSNIYFTYWNRRNLRGYITVINNSGNILKDSAIGTFMLHGIKFFNVSGYQFLLCGTAGRGYYQILNPNWDNINLERPKNNILAENYNSTVELQNSVVLDFFIDGGSDGDLYALTSTRGLWKNSDSGGYRTWSIE